MHSQCFAGKMPRRNTWDLPVTYNLNSYASKIQNSPGFPICDRVRYRLGCHRTSSPGRDI